MRERPPYFFSKLYRIYAGMQRAQFDSSVGKIPWRRDRLPTPVFLSFSCGSAGIESSSNAGDLGSSPGFGRSPRERKVYPLQYSGLKNSMNWIVHGVAKSQTQLSNFHSLHSLGEYLAHDKLSILTIVHVPVILILVVTVYFSWKIRVYFYILPSMRYSCHFSFIIVL